MSLRSRVHRNDEGTSDVRAPIISIFNQHDHTSEVCRERYLSEEKLKSTTLHILINCPEVQQFLK